MKGVATFLKNLIYQYSFHFIGIQETMIQECDEKLLRNLTTSKITYGCITLPMVNMVVSLWGSKRTCMMLDLSNRGILCFK